MKILFKYRSHIMCISIVIAAYLGAVYMNNNKVYSYEELMNFIASCGNFTKKDFMSTQREESDYFIVIISAFIVVLTLIYSFKFLFRPNESNTNHIKHQILQINGNEKKC